MCQSRSTSRMSRRRSRRSLCLGPGCALAKVEGGRDKERCEPVSAYRVEEGGDDDVSSEDRVS